MDDIDQAIGDLNGAAKQTVVGAANDNPDHAAEALSLSERTGAPAGAIFNDLPGYKAGLKQQLGAQIVDQNPKLGAYLSNPMAARVSNDDLGTLDGISGTLQKTAQPSVWDRLSTFANNQRSDDQKVVDAAWHGFDYSGQAQEFNDLYNFVPGNKAWQYLISATAPLTIGANAGLHAFQAGFEGGGELLSQVYGTLGGQKVYEGLSKGLEQAAQPLDQFLTRNNLPSMFGSARSGDPQKLSQDAQIMAQVAFAPEAHVPPELNRIAAEAKRTREIAQPYLDAGQPPPVGVDPHIDAAHLAQAQTDLANLKEALAQSQESTTRQRAPSMYAEFVRQHVDATIGVSPDAVRELYGTEVPHFDDGKLGFVDDLPAQLLRSTVTGEDIQVPVKDWLTRVSPELMQTLEPNIRTRPGGVTLAEADALAMKADSIYAYHGTAHSLDTFDLNKVGTGEGAGAFGHGLYFAENRKVAETYRDEQAGEGQGNLYQVRINRSPDEFLDWTDDIEDQPQYIQDALKKIGIDYSNTPVEYAPPMPGDMFGLERRITPYFNGETAYRDLVARGRTGNVVEDAESRPARELAASQALRDAGIAGIKYLDYHSRGGLSESRNYAVFNDKDVEITHKNDVAVSTVRAMAGVSDLDVPEELKTNLYNASDAVDKAFRGERGAILRKYIQDNFILSNGDFGAYLQRWFPDPREAKPLFDFFEASKRVQQERVRQMRAINYKNQVDRWNEPLGPADVRGGEPHPTETVPARHIKSVDGEDYMYHGRKFNPDDPTEFIDQYHKLGESAELNDVLHAYRTLSDVHLDPEQDLFTKHLAEVFEKHGVDKTPTYTIPKEEMGNFSKRADGLYYSDLRRILLKENNYKRNLLVTAHEGMHAVMHDAIEANTHGVRDDINDMMNVAIRSSSKGHYGFTNEHEFVSEALTNPEFRAFLDTVPMPAEVAAKIGARNPGIKSTIKTLWDGLVHAYGKLMGVRSTGEMSVLDYFMRYGDRLSAAAEQTARDRGAIDPSPMAALDEHAMQQHAQALGMNKAQLARYRELIERQRGEEADARNKEILAEERKRQTVEWKRNEAEMKKSVSAEFARRPDVLADSILRGGEKLDTDALTQEQRNVLGDAHTRGGVDPDALAHQLGYDTGDQMVKEVGELRATRGDAQPQVFFRNMVADEAAKRMEAQYGNLDRNVVEAAKERVLSDTQMELIHNDIEAAAGQQLPVTRAEVKQNVADAVSQMKMSAVRSDSALQAAGRAAQQIEDALLKGDAKAALAARFSHERMLLAAKEMLRIEKAKTAFAKTAKRYSARSVDGASQEYVDFIHEMLSRVGMPVSRTGADLADAISKSGYANLGEFVDAKTGALRDLHVPDFLLDDKFSSKLDDLTAEQFEQVHDALKAMVFNARDELKVLRSGEKADLADVMKEMRESLQSLGAPKRYDWSPEKHTPANVLKATWWSSVNLEAMLNRFDRGDPKGVFNQTLVRQYTSAANYKERVATQFQEKMRAFGRVPDFDKAVQNDLFVDQITGEKLPMTRKNLLGVLQNIGNPDNLKKLAGGYNLDPKAVVDWVIKNTTKEDWDRAQGIGDIFGELHDMADNMSREVSGVGIDKVPLSPISTPFGEYKGWYNPIAYDKLRPGKSKTLLGPDALEANGYFRATTAKGYTKARTQYIAPVQLDLNVVLMRMNQMIHDITMRPTILQLSKFFYDPAFKQDIIRYYGSHQAEQLIPFLRDVANSPNFQSEAAQIGNQALRQIASNTVGALIGLNPSTVAKHGPTAAIKSVMQVGPINFAREFIGLLRSDPETSKSNWSMAMEKSDELARRMRNFQELLANTGQDVSLSTSSGRSLYRDVRSVAQYIGTLPVATSDVLSAVPTWLASYKEAIANGEDEGSARDLADRDVRQAHGSSIITNKPQIARSKNPLVQSFATLYGFFSENLQKQYEIAWRAKDALGYGASGDYAKAMAQVPKIASLIFTSTIIPALIEEAVTPMTNDKHESWGHYAFWTMAMGMSSSLLGFRDVMHAISSGHDSAGGLFGTTMKGITDVGKDIRDLTEGKRMTTQRAANMVKHAFTLGGFATGLTNAQEGKSLAYMYRYFHGLEHPHNAWQAAVGMRYGTGKGHL